MVQGKMTDLLTYRLNTDLMYKSEKLQSISYFEDSEFYNDIQLLSSEASWRPVNLLVFGTSLISNAVMFGSMLLIVSSINMFVSILLLIVLIPQGMITYKIQQQAFETLVSNSEESRKLDYYSQVLLSNNHIKDVRLYNLYSFFINKYTESFMQVNGKLQTDRRKKSINSTLFITLTSLIILAMFAYVIHQIQIGKLEIGVIFVFSTSIIYSINSMARLIEDSSLLYDTLLYMEKFFGFIEIDDEMVYDTTDCLIEHSSDIQSIEFKHISFSYPQTPDKVLDDICFEISKGEKIAIVGENGAGKTTLLRMIINEDSDYSGEIVRKGDIAYVPQIKELKDGSGGEITLRLLKKAFSLSPSILILDEPTSHLDQENVQWLIHKLLRFNGTIIIVSHDRFLLDYIPERIFFIDEGEIETYVGNFTEFEDQKNKKRKQLEKEIAHYKNKVTRLTEELENKKIKSQKILKKKTSKISNSDWKVSSKMGSYDSQAKAIAKSAKAIEKRISRLPEPPKIPTQAFIKFKSIGHLENNSPRTLIRIEEGNFKTKFIELKLPMIKMKFGERWLLTGRNKSGKSTLLKSIVKKDIDGYFSNDLKIGYFSQNLDLLNKEKSLFENIYSISIQNERLIINLLAMLGLKKDKIFIPCKNLSGGEQVKGQLALTFLSDSNFLILDEPTNFLDINLLAAFEDFLLNFPGSVLLVCHDTYIQKNIHFKSMQIRGNEVFLENYF
ncbi:ABC transporter ATP-binding protein/peptidase [Streptococcus pseudoporcinus]|uniref:ABC transporter ATP-binding protein/peptidase n=2 Tax=Streptococcus pseudoporcinus TaxID=361101 RepID=A0A4U9XLG4_9STRE|nr:ABC transporter ATP-binding protein/peptidase [Streptococcus pseudoporcinus]